MKMIAGIFGMVLCVCVSASAGLQEDYKALTKEYRALQKKVNEVRYGETVGGSPEMKAADAAYMEAMREWKKARENHPELKELMAKDEELKKAFMKTLNKGPEGEKAKAAYTENRRELERKASELEDLKALNVKFNEKARELQEIEKKLIAKHPELVADMAKLEVLRKKRSAMRKKMRAAKG